VFNSLREKEVLEGEEHQMHGKKLMGSFIEWREKRKIDELGGGVNRFLCKHEEKVTRSTKGKGLGGRDDGFAPGKTKVLLEKGKKRGESSSSMKEGNPIRAGSRPCKSQYSVKQAPRGGDPQEEPSPKRRRKLVAEKMEGHSASGEKKKEGNFSERGRRPAQKTKRGQDL